MAHELTRQSATAIMPNVSGANTDHELVALWLGGRHSAHTRRSYAHVVENFMAAVRKPLRAVTVADVQGFAAGLGGAESSKATRISAVKSLLSYAHRTGYVPFNVGAAVEVPKAKATLAERIIPEADVHRLFALEPTARNRALLRLLYVSGARVSELVALRWRDVRPREAGGQITLYGKGRKTRAVFLPESVSTELTALRDGATDNAPVFVSRKGGPLDVSAARRVVYAAGKRVGIANVSPHWLRHAHASHALDRGAPIHLVQATLGHASVSTTSRYLHARPNDSSARYLAV